MKKITIFTPEKEKLLTLIGDGAPTRVKRAEDGHWDEVSFPDPDEAFVQLFQSGDGIEVWFMHRNGTKKTLIGEIRAEMFGRT